MELKILKPRKALNKAFLKLKPNRTEIESFKTNLIQLLDQINDAESEEFHKNLVSDFLKKTYYEPTHFINTKGRNDLVIHNGNKAKNSVGVIIETKKPTNKVGMLTKDKINVKAFHELILYYLRERITHKNLEINYLVATNINEWFIFDEHLFERIFAQNKKFVKQFQDFEAGKKSTEVFYKEIATPFINEIKQEIEYTFFDIRAYEKLLRNDNLEDDNKLISLFKLLSPTHLLKLPYANDSNSLDKQFYGELLYIIGLVETKNGSKKLIERNKKGERNTGSFLENAIIQLDSLDKITRLDNPSHFGTTQEERLFNVGLELSLTWMNRILFLKLLEAQLKTYHKGDKSYHFLSIDKVQNYDDLNSLFFQVLAKKQSERSEDITEIFAKIPYLNSSLFEPTGIEHETLFISNLRDEKTIPIYSSTVLKSESGKKRTGNLSTLEYLFEFLNAYDFSSEGKEEIQEDNKTLINASVLGLIFEKINGYKEGSFFTPGFITMYMCRETIRKAVVQKFNDIKNWNCKDYQELKEDIQEYIKENDRKKARKEANDIVNSLKICDPAVGSGHFLVSALNEMIAIKSDLKILVDREDERISDFDLEVVNDELVIYDIDENHLFEYQQSNKNSLRLQKALFHEKQTIIENCLFGVDINPNSVKICRLRLWIELLKNAYYKNETELETLPNIDINIKCGNSLISRFDLDADIKKALKKSKWTIEIYKIAVNTYHNAQNKEEKRKMEGLIHDIKKDFQTEIRKNSKEQKQLDKLGEELYLLTGQGGKGGIGLMMFEPKEEYGTKENKKKRGKKIAKIAQEIEALTQKMEAIKSNKIYEKAFEWRFEFPEVLNDNGDFVGFDAVIGNPPYFQLQYTEYGSIDYLKKFEVYEKTGDIYSLFFEKSFSLLQEFGILSFITSNRFCNTNYGTKTREFLSKFGVNTIVNINDVDIFEEANVGTFIGLIGKKKSDNLLKSFEIKTIEDARNIQNVSNLTTSDIQPEFFGEKSWIFSSNAVLKLKNKLEQIGTSLSQIKDIKINRGITTGANSVFIIDKKKGENFIKANPKNAEIIKPVLKGAEIKRYFVKEFSNYVILTKTGVDITDYNEVYEYLLENREALEKVYEAKKGMKKWYELRNCTYYDAFQENKLIWTRLANINSFAISTKNEYSIDSTSFAVGENLKYYSAILNSKTVFFYFKLGSVIWGKDGIKWFGDFFDNIPIPIASDGQKKEIKKIVNDILETKKMNSEADTSGFEKKINQLVYQLYNLTKEEIKIIEEANASSSTFKVC